MPQPSDRLARVTSRREEHRSGRARPGSRITSALSAGVATLALALGAALPATAVPPLDLTSQITDPQGYFDGGEDEVRAALVELDREDGIDLFVVVVDSTDGTDTAEWADETAVRSGLGPELPLLVMAAEDGDYALSVDDRFRLDDQQTQQVTDAVEGPFAAGDHAGAAVAAAQEMREVAAPSPLRWFVLAAVLLAFGWVLAAIVRRRRQAAGAGGPAGLRAAPAPGAPQVPLEELSRQANRMLVATDEDVRGAERELAFAQAEFGDEAARPFVEALAEAKQNVVTGFALRQRLDDAEPETEKQQRQMLGQVVALCGRSREVLAAQAEAFAELRNIAGRVAELVPALGARADAVEGSVPAAAGTVADLTTRFSPSAVEAVAQAPAQAAERIAEARALLATTGTAPHPAVAVRTAEEQVVEAERLLASIARVAEEVSEAGRLLPRAVSALAADLHGVRAGRFPPGAGLEEAVTRSEAALAYAESSGRVDPVGALSRLTEADALIDRATAAAREVGERVQRAAAVLPETLAAARARFASVEGVINANHQFVGGTARTRASEAARLLSEAETVAAADPEAAVSAARRSFDLSLAAEEAARSDLQAVPWDGSGMQYRQVDAADVLGAIFGGGWSSGSGGSWGGGGGSFGGGGWGGGRVSRAGGIGRSLGGRSSGGFSSGRRSSGRSSSRRGSRRR